MSECVFCNSYEMIKRIDTDFEHDADYSVAMIRYINSGKKKHDKLEDHTWGVRYELNFCPVCGKRLK